MASADVSTAVVVYQPDFLTISPEGDLSFEGQGEIVAYTARPVDAEAWLATVDYTEVTSLPDWEELGTQDVAVPSPSPSPSASPEPSGSASASASPKAAAKTTASPSPSASPSASASPAPVAAPTDADPFIATEGRSTDTWRSAFTGTDQLGIAVASVPTGETLVVMSADGSALSATSLSLTRVVNDDWITPLLWWGAILVVVGIAALVVLFIDLRPAQSRGESWMASRKAAGRADGEPGSRRSRRAAGAAMPEASLDDAPVAPIEANPSDRDSSAPDARSEGIIDAPVAADDNPADDESEGGPDAGPATDGTEDRA